MEWKTAFRIQDGNYEQFLCPLDYLMHLLWKTQEPCFVTIIYIVSHF